VFVLRDRLARFSTSTLLAFCSLLHGAATLDRARVPRAIRVGLDYSTENLFLMLAIYGLSALPFLTEARVVSLSFARLASRINMLYAADLLGAATGCLLLLPLLNALGAARCGDDGGRAVDDRGAVFLPASGACGGRPWSDRAARRPSCAQLAGRSPFAVVDTKGHLGDRILFSKWNSFSRVAVYDRSHGDWSLSPHTRDVISSRCSWTSTRRPRRQL
jgi:hypothetical protein